MYTMNTMLCITVLEILLQRIKRIQINKIFYKMFDFLNITGYVLYIRR